MTRPEAKTQLCEDVIREENAGLELGGFSEFGSFVSAYLTKRSSITQHSYSRVEELHSGDSMRNLL